MNLWNGLHRGRNCVITVDKPLLRKEISLPKLVSEQSVPCTVIRNFTTEKEAQNRAQASLL